MSNEKNPETVGSEGVNGTGQHVITHAFIKSSLWTGLNKSVMKQKQRHKFLTCHKERGQPATQE